MFVDTHVHLQMKEYNEDRDAVVAASAAAGLVAGIVPGFDVATSLAAERFANDHAAYYATVGIHPHHAADATPNAVAQLQEVVQAAGKIVGWGEFGLDFHRLPDSETERHATIKQQEDAFTRQLDVALKLDLPLVIHCRDAYERLAEILNDDGRAPYRGVMHSFTGTAEEVQPFLELGFHVAFNGVITFAKEKSLQDAVRLVPLNRLLLETDAPFLAPASRRGKRNDSTVIPEIAERVAELTSKTTEEVLTTTTENAKLLFSIE